MQPTATNTPLAIFHSSIIPFRHNKRHDIEFAMAILCTAPHVHISAPLVSLHSTSGLVAPHTGEPNLALQNAFVKVELCANQIHVGADKVEDCETEPAYRHVPIPPTGARTCLRFQQDLRLTLLAFTKVNHESNMYTAKVLDLSILFVLGRTDGPKHLHSRSQTPG